MRVGGVASTSAPPAASKPVWLGGGREGAEPVRGIGWLLRGLDLAVCSLVYVYVVLL